MIREKIKTADGVLGSGSVELYDGLTGKLYRVEKFENFLSLNMLRYQRQAIRADYQRNILAPQNTQDPVPGYPLTHLGAWNDNSAESPSTEDTPNGGMVGYANKTAFGGADPFRGGINMAESFNSPTQMKWVFDWPTTSANGTFQSVGWCSLAEGNHGGPGSWALSSTKLLGPNYCGGSASQSLTVDPVSDKLYQSHTSGFYEVNPVTGAQGALVFANAGESFVAYDGTGTPGFWFAKTAVGVNPCLVKRTLANAIIAQVNTTWTAVFGTAVGPSALAFDGTYLYSHKGGTTIYRITPSTGVTTSFSVATVMTDVVTLGSDPWGVLAATYSHKTNSPYGNNIYQITRWDSTGKYLAKWMVNDGGWDSARGMGAGIAYRPSNRVHYIVITLPPSPYLLTADLAGSLATRTLLGAPVTKDVTKSMKINYTFSFV